MIYLGLPDAQEAEWVAERLRSWGVRTFSDGLLLHAEIQARPPELVVADLVLPGLDGLLLARLVKFCARLASVRVALVGHTAPERWEAVRADALLTRPLELDALLGLAAECGAGRH